MLIGLGFGGFLETHFRTAESVALMLIVVGGLFFLPMKPGGAKMDFKKACMIGCAQALALIPGVSRSGATLLCGNQLGLSQVEAARFSFLLGAIAIAGAGFLTSLEGNLEAVDPTVLVVGAGTAFLSSMIAVSALMRYLSKHSLKVFGVYRIALGLGVLLFSIS